MASAAPPPRSSLIVSIDGGTARGTRVTVKDLIDVAGYPTTAGCRAVADEAQPATGDAACLAGLREAERAGTARLVGKANLHELAAGPTGVNPWYGTPMNPCDPSRVPGGSSSGSAAGVGADEADISYGSDTGGSIRIPSACCGTTGLKTTWGRIPLPGVMAMAPTFDVVGPMARDVAGVVEGMALLEPSFAAARDPATTVGRLRMPGTDPVIDAAIDEALRGAELDVVEVQLDGWSAAADAAVTLICSEFFAQHAALFERAGDRIGADVRGLFDRGRAAGADGVARAGAVRRSWDATLEGWFSRVQLLALPVLRVMPAPLEQSEIMYGAACTAPVSLAGLPALALPLGNADAPVPPSLQLVGPARAEELLLATGAALERAVGG